ncbi:hypothetical protein HYX18_01420 [Candidatus Woesearchaeota archaeon]|nr:hypothetical protein [Candidatus Woesearchaeota archaeon]
MDRTKYDIEIKHHVFVRAMQRGINPDLIERTITNGKIEKFGKNYIKFISKSVICIGEISGLKLKVITIEWRHNKK